MSVNDTLTIIMVIVALLNQSGGVRITGLIVAFFFGVHRIADPMLSDQAYYWFAVACDAMIVWSLVNIHYAGQRGQHMHRVALLCTISALINVIGWLMWLNGVGPIVYNIAVTITYVLLIATFVDGDRVSDNSKGYINHIVAVTSGRSMRVVGTESKGKK